MERRSQRMTRTWKTLCTAGVLAIAQPLFGQTEPSGRKTIVTAPRAVATVSSASSNGTAMNLDPARVRLDNVKRLGTSNGVAGIAPGFTVYDNTLPSAPIFRPGANERMADDIMVGGGIGACPLTYFSFTVAAEQGSAAFDASVEFWDGDPCEATSAPIPGTQQTFTGLTPEPRGPVPGFTAWLLEVTPAAGITLPESSWLAITVTSDFAGWPVGEKAEVGFTTDAFSLTNPTPDTTCSSTLFFNGEPYAGFLAKVNCDLPQAPLGACCTGTTCSQTTEANCIGFFQGSFSSCSPDPCTPGTCCRGTGFDTCTDESAASCDNGFFTPNAICADGCPGNFRGFANNFDTGFFNPIDVNSLGQQVLWADDIRLEPGAACDLFGFDVLVTGGGPTAPPTFDAHLELRFNDVGVPGDPADDSPMAGAAGLIPGTAQDFLNIPSDLLPHRLLVSVPPGVLLPDRFWMVLSTSAPDGAAINSDAGPLLSGTAKLGFSEDLFAIFNSDDFGLDIWSFTAFFGGFDPTGCPGEATCAAAGSFRANVWCRDIPPTGACCDNIAGTCIDGVTQVECPGNWLENETCVTATFNPPCGTHGCCSETLISPGNFLCVDRTIEQCNAIGGSVSLGQFCGSFGNVCPTNTCSGGTNAGGLCGTDAQCLGGGICEGCQNKQGDCYSNNGTPGCDDPFCCQQVGLVDPFCATGNWDQNCADRAITSCRRTPPNDVAANAEPITEPPPGQAAFSFAYDNTFATMDGPTHDTCADFDDNTIANDLWHCWTAPCTATAFVETCNRTTVDTKIAVYDGCGPPSDANLLGCDDDSCGYQSRTTFDSIMGNAYLVRIGTFAGAELGPGAFSITCGATNCPGTSDCCNAVDGSGLTGCNDTACCSAVCALDSFCCDVEWDNACATTGFEGSGFGAALLCPDLCGTGCPDGPVTFVDPPHRVVDAGTPHVANDPSALLTIDRLSVTAPVGADAVECWSLCETAVAGTANSVASVVDNGGGSYTLMLARPMTPGAVTTVTYTTNATTGIFTSHPGNVNADAATGPGDILSVIDCLNDINVAGNCPWGDYSGDVDRSGVTSAPDILMVIDLLNGASGLDPWNATPLPDPTSCVP